MVLNSGGKNKNKKERFPLAPMGLLAPGSAHARPSLQPPIAEIFRHMCLQSHLQTSPPTTQKSYPKFRNPRKTFEIFTQKTFTNLKTPHRGQGGLRIFLGVNISFFVGINPLWSFWTLTDLLLIFFKKNFKKTKNHPQGGQRLFRILSQVRQPRKYELVVLWIFCGRNSRFESANKTNNKFV